MWREIKKLIQSHQRFVLTTHEHPDGDGIGAACALAELLLLMGKHVRLVCEGPLPKKFSFLDSRNLYQEFDPSMDFHEEEVLIVLDTHRQDRIGRIAALASEMVSVCIDHHPVTDTFTSFVAIDPHACSVGAMIYTLFKESGFDLNIAAATGIYASIIWDTGRFSYSSTDRKAHKIADECIKLGVDADLMHSRLFQHIPIWEVKVFGRALQRMETPLDGRVAIQEILREDYEDLRIPNIEHVDFGYIHEFNKLIEKVECAALFLELSDDRVRISLRSQSDLDVASIARAFGGGGHCKAAGALWKGLLSEAKQKVLHLIQQSVHPKNL